MSHTFSIHLNPEKYWTNRKKQKKKMHVTHILNPPKPRKILTKNREKSRRRKKGRRKWMSHTFSIHLNPEKYWKKQEKTKEEENACHTHSQST